MPMCPTMPVELSDPVNKIISPGLDLAISIVVPSLVKSTEDLGVFTPKCPNTYVINPEQSSPFAGTAEPHLYGVPSKVFAKETKSALSIFTGFVKVFGLPPGVPGDAGFAASEAVFSLEVFFAVLQDAAENTIRKRIGKYLIMKQ